MLRVGLTGGIGSGKSTAAKIFSTLGVPVYDSDSRAKELMHNDILKEKITALFGQGAYKGGNLDRKFIAGVAFSDKSMLEKLNRIVHPCVMDDFDRWAEQKKAGGYLYVIQENAILFDHGFDKSMDYTITISAPIEERVARASLRDGHDPRDIRKRINNQLTDGQREIRADFTIKNGERDLILPRIEKLHNFFISQVEQR